MHLASLIDTECNVYFSIIWVESHTKRIMITGEGNAKDNKRSPCVRKLTDAIKMRKWQKWRWVEHKRRRNYNRWDKGLVVVSLKIWTMTGQISRGISNKTSWPSEKYLEKVFVSQWTCNLYSYLLILIYSDTRWYG